MLSSPKWSARTESTFGHEVVARGVDDLHGLLEEGDVARLAHAAEDMVGEALDEGAHFRATLARVVHLAVAEAARNVAVLARPPIRTPGALASSTFASCEPGATRYVLCRR